MNNGTTNFYVLKQKLLKLQKLICHYLRIVMRVIRFILFLILPAFSVSGKGDYTKKELPFKAGERLTYQVYYGPLNGGKALITLDQAEFNGKEVLHAKALGYTTGLVDKLFKVYDIYESYFDPVSGLPVKTIRNVSEGSYKKYNEVTFNRENNTVTSMLSGVVEVPGGIMDMVSAFYKLRDTMQVVNLQPDEKIKVDTYFNDEILPVEVIYTGVYETINTRMGTFNAIKFYPVSQPGKIFKGENDITVWLSDDFNLVPLRVKLNMWVGSVKMDLIEYEGLMY